MIVTTKIGALLSSGVTSTNRFPGGPSGPGRDIIGVT
jgi:hypothetical protein